MRDADELSRFLLRRSETFRVEEFWETATAMVPEERSEREGAKKIDGLRV